MTRFDRRRVERGSALGNLITALLLLGLIGLGVYLWLGQQPGRARTSPPTDARMDAPADRADDPAQADAAVPEPIEPVVGTPVLEAAAAYAPRDGVVQIDISEYAGYGGLIVANGGLEPSPDSFFAREYGFQVRISMSESETWSPLNNGRLAATATTADVLPVLGRQFEAVIPVQIGYSRGADMVVVDRGIPSVNALAGKVLAASQFNESEFFIRYLAQEAGVPVAVLRDLDARAPPGALGLVFYEDAFVACDAYERELGRPRPAAPGLRRLDAPHGRGRGGLERRGQGARVEQEPPRRRGRPRREQRLRAGAAGHGRGARPRASRGESAAARPAGRARRPRRPGVRLDAGRGPRGARAGAPREPPREPRLLRGHDRLRRLLRRHLPVVGAGVRVGDQEPRRPGPLRRHDAPGGAREEGPLRRPEDRDRADPEHRTGRARRRPAPQQGHPLLLRAELVDPRQERRRRTSTTWTRSSASSR